MNEVTFVVPAAPYHETLLERALASIEAQTVSSDVIVIRDTERRGAGWARNQGLRQVRTPYLIFLDADDEVLPTYVEHARTAWKSQRFVYTDWLDGDRPFRAPDCPWMANTRNTITSLLATDDVQRVGGFDESLQGMEDTHFFLKLLSSGVCGLHLKETLFRYSPDGQRSKAFYQTADYHALMRRLNHEFKGLRMTQAGQNCGGCGGSPYLPLPDTGDTPVGEQQSGDVLAQALWVGNRQQRGRISGRLYPRTSTPAKLWVDRRDIQASPQWFAEIGNAPPTVEDFPGGDEDDFARFASQVRTAMNRPFPSPRPIPEPPLVIPTATDPVEVQPDIGRVLRMYNGEAQLGNSHVAEKVTRRSGRPRKTD